MMIAITASSSSSSSSSVGSNFFALFSLVVASLLVVLLLRRFLPLRTTPAYLLLPVFLALAIPISIVLLVPIDLASNARTGDEATRGIWLPDGALRIAWRIAYWLTFALTWFILPLLGEYVDSGFRTPKDRIIYSLRSNARYQLILLACGLVGLLYVFWQNGFKGTSLRSLVIALAYCWALVQAIYLMGHGLVAVPRRLFRNASIGGRLRRIQARAPKVHDSLDDAVTDLDDLETQLLELRQRKNGISRDHHEWVEELVDPSTAALPRATGSLPATPGPAVPAVVTDRYLADLGRRLTRARHKRLRFTDGWNRLVQEAADTQTILDSVASRKLEFGRPAAGAPRLARSEVLTPHLRYLLHVHLAPAARMALGGFLALASVCIVWSEFVKFAAPKLSIIAYTVVHHANSDQGKIGFAGQVIASLWIMYMCSSALASFDDVKTWRNRALVPRNTYGESACWYAGQVAKLTVPLTFNFITFLPPEIHKATMFYRFLGNMIVFTPLGKGFDYFFPIFILVPVCATLFNLYGRIKAVFGFGIVDDDGDDAVNSSGYGTGNWREGRDLIDRELHGRSNLESSTLLNSRANDGTRTHSAPIRSQNHSWTPDLHVPPAHGVPAPELQAQRGPAATQAGEEGDESIFSEFAHRVKNTIDSVEAPEWLRDLSKRPKWMRGEEEEDEETSGRAQSGRGFGRWFGGRAVDGRVRL